MAFNPDFGGDAGDLYQEIVEKNQEIRELQQANTWLGVCAIIAVMLAFFFMAGVL